MKQPPDTGFDDWLAARSDEPSGPDRIVPEGARLGPWTAGGLLGRGGSGEVYHAEDAEAGSRAEGAVALKVLHRTDAAAAGRFRREAAILREHPHPALPRFFGSGETADGRPWMAVEELEKRELPSRDRDVARFILALCGGVAHLHALGLVHRDVKPSNVLFRADGAPVLIDLGLAKPIQGPETDGRATGPSTISVVDGKAVGVGTPGYAAPEQFAGGEVSPASDTYALGVLADACFGHRPPRCWRAILRRATSALPAARYPSAEALARAIRRRHAPRAAVLAAAVAAVAAAAAAAALADSPAPRTPAAQEPREDAAPPPVLALAERLAAEAEPAWREVASYSVYDGRPFVRVRLEGRHVALARPLDLTEPQTVEIVGPGRLDATIAGTPETLVSVRGATVVDATEDPNPAHSPRFRLGVGAFVSLPKVLSIFPEEFAEPYDEPNPENPSPGDRALRFTTAETTLGGQMALERECLAEAAARAAEEREIPAPGLGAATGLTNAVWTTGSVHPVRVEGDPANGGSLVLSVPGGIGQAWCSVRARDLQPFTVECRPYFAGRAEHGGRGGAYEQLDGAVVMEYDQRSGRPVDPPREFPMTFYPGVQLLTFRFRSDLWAPDGHAVGVRLRLVPND